MKKASKFEKVAARCWNVLNEGRPFTPVYVMGIFLLFHFAEWQEVSFWSSFGIGLLSIVPLFVIYFLFDFPITLRKYLWIPFMGAFLLYEGPSLELALFALGMYFFFTVIFWGTIYYHLRIGTTLWNFTRFWKLVLKNSDSTSGNSQEQIPKFLTLLAVLQGNVYGYQLEGSIPWLVTLAFSIAVMVFSIVLHRLLFNWKPEEIPTYTHNVEPGAAKTDRIVMVVIDGCRKDRLAEANTPFLDWLAKNGTQFDQMETVYPARTVVCFSSMFTGTYPREHGITSNMVYKLGINCESIFDSLRKVGKKGRLLGVAHLVDSMGDDVDTYTAVAKNDQVDGMIINRAKEIMEEKNPDLMIVQLISTDQTGHSRGALYEEYREKIEEADAHVAGFYQWLTEKGYMENTTFMVCADHGQSDGIGGHGHLDEGERFVPFIMHGPAIRKGVKVDAKHSLVSVAPTLAYLLGAPYPNKSRGPVLIEALREEGIRDEKEKVHRHHTSA